MYFAALVTYAAVFHASPVGAAAPPEVEPATAAALQPIAWDFVRDYCQNHFSNADANNGSNPFKWPDPGLQPWPAP